jgi:hypothetical protein
MDARREARPCDMGCRALFRGNQAERSRWPRLALQSELGKDAEHPVGSTFATSCCDVSRTALRERIEKGRATSTPSVHVAVRLWPKAVRFAQDVE